jgi:hypothetical protein
MWKAREGQYGFAGAAKDDNVMGKDARVIVERVLEKQGLL